MNFMKEEVVDENCRTVAHLTPQQHVRALQAPVSLQGVSMATMHTPNRQDGANTLALDKIFSRSSFQSLSTTRDVMDFPQSPLTESLTESLNSSRSSGVEAFIDQNIASSLALALDSDDVHCLDPSCLQAGLERQAIPSPTSKLSLRPHI